MAAPAFAQDTTVAPTFAYAEKPKEDAKRTGWQAEAKAGLLWLAGNSDSTSLSAGLKITRDDLWQRYSLTANYAYAKSRLYVGPDPTQQLPIGPDGKPVVTSFDQLRADSALSARLWNVTPRFDQWIIHRNAPGDTSVYVLGNIASDFAAGKKLFGGGQVGVSTLLVKAGKHSLTGELGYDYTYLQPYDPSPGVHAEGYGIHSLRAALAYIWDISKATKFTAGAEYLINLNKETGAPDPNDPTGVPAFQDHRVNAIVGLTTQVYERLSLNVSWTGRYDAKPNLATLPAGVSSSSRIFLRTFDSITQVQFVYTFG
jgi:hypothetical protein